MSKVIKPIDVPPVDTNMTSLKALRERQEEEITGKEERQFTTARDILKTPETENQNIIGTVYQRGHVSIFYGESDAGKSQFLQQMSLAIVMGDRSFLGFTISADHRRVIYVATEDIDQDIKRVIGRMVEEHDSEHLDRLEYVLDDNITESLETLTKHLRTRLKESPADLIVIDAMLDIMDSSVNDANQMRRGLMRTIKGVAKDHQCHIILLTHVSKGKQRNGADKNNILGSQAIEASSRLAVEYKLDPDPMRENIRHLCITKGNHLHPDMKRSSFELERDPDTFKVHATGHRVPVEMLAKNPTHQDPDFILRATELREKGLSHQKIGNELGVGETTVRRAIVPLEESGKITKGTKGGYENDEIGVRDRGTKKVRKGGTKGVRDGGTKTLEHEAVISRHEKGMGYGKIASELGIPKSTVQSIIKRKDA